MEDSFSTVEGFQYIEGTFNTVEDNFSTVGYLQYCGGCSVQWDNISTVGDNIITMEAIQHSGEVFHFANVLPLEMTTRYRYSFVL